MSNAVKIVYFFFFLIGNDMSLNAQSNEVQAVILAAGRSTRFKGSMTKLLSPVCGKKMILLVTDLFAGLDIPMIFVVGHQKEALIDAVRGHGAGSVNFVEQKEQLGTGHAVLMSKDLWNSDHILICNGDMPLITPDIIQNLYDTHCNSGAAISFIAAHLDHPELAAYGRVVTDVHGRIAIVEDKDFTGNKAAPCDINAGIYLVQKDFLLQSVQSLDCNNKSNEFYVTDIVRRASMDNKTVSVVSAPFDSIRGVNTLEELREVEAIADARAND